MGAPAILLVEDNPDHRELVLLALRDCCDPSLVLAVPDGEEALDYLLARGVHAGRETRSQPRLVILDLKMTKVGGREVLRAMRSDSRTIAVPVVVLSASREKAELGACYGEGANSVVMKSANFEEMRQKMRRIYEFWITVNEADRPSRV